MNESQVIDMPATTGAAPLMSSPMHEIALQPQAQVTPMELMVVALKSGAPIEQMERLMAMQIQWDQHQLVLAKVDAEKAFNEAMASFKANPPEIVKDSHVNYTTLKGTTDYWHASHHGVTTAIAKGLAAHGLSHSWTSLQDAGKITVTCTIKHRLGHSESTSMTASYDESGGKNAIQAVISAKSYLERHTLTGITGTSTKDMPDDDGKGAVAPPVVVESVLQGLLAQVGKAGDDKACVALWNTGKPTLVAMGDHTAYAEFKVAIEQRRTALKVAAQ